MFLCTAEIVGLATVASYDLLQLVGRDANGLTSRSRQSRLPVRQSACDAFGTQNFCIPKAEQVMSRQPHSMT